MAQHTLCSSRNDSSSSSGRNTLPMWRRPVRRGVLGTALLSDAALAEVLAGLGGASGAPAQAAALVAAEEQARAARRAALHGEWRAQVFDKIQSRIAAAAAQRPVRELEAALLRSAYACSSSGGGGGGGAAAPWRLTYAAGDVNDPLKRDLLREQAERRLLSIEALAARSGSGSASGSGNRTVRGSGGRTERGGGDKAASLLQGETMLERSVTRETLATTKWGALHIAATPYGHCIDPATALYTVRPAPAAALALRASRIVFDDWAAAGADAAASRAGKRPAAGGARRDHIAEQRLLGGCGGGAA